MLKHQTLGPNVCKLHPGLALWNLKDQALVPLQFNALLGCQRHGVYTPPDGDLIARGLSAWRCSGLWALDLSGNNYSTSTINSANSNNNENNSITKVS